LPHSKNKDGDKMIKRALISVSNKEGIIEFARELKNLNIEILSTGGTAKLLRGAGIEVKDVSEITGFPECLDGRVKTLHPAIHGGILAIRDNEEHMKTLANLNIDTMDLIVINLYPFKETILRENVKLEEAIENIDIGGPAMLRAAAKNYNDVTVVINPQDYDVVIGEIRNNGNTSIDTRYDLALKVFEHTAHYDSLIADYLRTKAEKPDIFPETLTLTYEKVQDLRYGENPHQKAAFYKEIGNNISTRVSSYRKAESY
jgi:phosphoribosylaminoimidazolecarboxamide formyltransferase/IMP cyclohydrolase